MKKDGEKMLDLLEIDAIKIHNVEIENGNLIITTDDPSTNGLKSTTPKDNLYSRDELK